MQALSELFFLYAFLAICYNCCKISGKMYLNSKIFSTFAMIL